MKKLATTFGLLALMLIVTSFTTPSNLGGTQNGGTGGFDLGGTQNGGTGGFDLGGTQNAGTGN